MVPIIIIIIIINNNKTLITVGSFQHEHRDIFWW
jgi:hypothetical protein